MVTMTSLTATFQAVPMLRAQGDCDIKSSICCFMLKGNQGELELIRHGAGSSFAWADVDWGLHSAPTQGASWAHLFFIKSDLGDRKEFRTASSPPRQNYAVLTSPLSSELHAQPWKQVQKEETGKIQNKYGKLKKLLKMHLYTDE